VGVWLTGSALAGVIAEIFDIDEEDVGLCCKE
jgi:hypothetical protein